MARGFSLPMMVDQGRTALDQGVEQMRKIIRLAVLDGASSNPFNRDVGTPSPIFQGATPMARAALRRAVSVHFSRWKKQNRAELLDLQIGEETQTGEMLASLTYRDLDTDTANSLAIPIGSPT